MSVSHLQCIRCGMQDELGERYLCDRCGGILEVIHDYTKNKAQLLREIQARVSPRIWMYQSLLPVRDSENFVTLFEGGTPLIRCKNLSRKIGFENLYVKDESRNPSGAFKDRPIAVGISKAKELNQQTVTTASSGNAAASLATYAARAGLTCYVFVPETTPGEKVAQALVNGGNIVKVKGTYSDAYTTALAAARAFHWINITTTFLNPYAIEGDKTIAYEMFQQLHGTVPEWILVPTGAGPLLFGIHKGYLELRRLGLADKAPRMVAVQAAGCAPIVRAFDSGEANVEPWGAPRTVASAIADPLQGYAQDGELVLRTVRESDGKAIRVSDTEIVEAVFELAGNEGIYAEPAAAAPFAALKRLVADGTITQSDRAVCINTGHGLKDPKRVIGKVDVPRIEPSLDALAKLIGGGGSSMGGHPKHTSIMI